MLRGVGRRIRQSAVQRSGWEPATSRGLAHQPHLGAGSKEWASNRRLTLWMEGGRAGWESGSRLSPMSRLARQAGSEGSSNQQRRGWPVAQPAGWEPSSSRSLLYSQRRQEPIPAILSVCRSFRRKPLRRSEPYRNCCNMPWGLLCLHVFISSKRSKGCRMDEPPRGFGERTLRRSPDQPLARDEAITTAIHPARRILLNHGMASGASGGRPRTLFSATSVRGRPMLRRLRHGRRRCTPSH